MKRIEFSPPSIGEDEKNAAIQVIDSNWLTQGKQTEMFELEIAKYLNCKEAVVVNNGTSALLTALWANDIKRGDEVIVPSYTFMATINAVLGIGAKPVLCDIDLESWNTTPELMAEKITPKTKAIIPVDVAGMSIDINSFEIFAKNNNLVLIEDSAEAIGGAYKKQKSGSFEHASIFSFHIAKLITTIEGGCITTNDQSLAKKCRLIRNHGMEKKYHYTSFGLNFRTTDLQSAIGRVQLKKLDHFVSIRNRLVNLYKEKLNGLVSFQKIPDYVTTHPFMIFGIKVDPMKRDEINLRLNEEGVDTRMWPAIFKSPYHKQFFSELLPNSEIISNSIINLPIGNGLSEQDVLYVCEILKKILKEVK